MRKQCFRIHQKYGIEILKNIKEAQSLDTATGTTYWIDATRKEMMNYSKAFETLPEGSRIPAGHTHIKCHLIFDVKHGSFKRKAWYLTGGHMTAPPASSVSRMQVL